MRLHALHVRLTALGVLALALSSCVAGAPPVATTATPGGPAGKTTPGRTPPPMIIDPATYDYSAQVVTTRGVITIRLFDDIAPRTVNNFVTLARRNFFVNQAFHRITPNVAQTGDPGGTGTGGPGYSVEVEPNDLLNTRGTIGMARTPGSTTFGSQWYINLTDNPEYDTGDHYYPFGEVTAGFEVLDMLAAAGTPEGTPTADISIARISIIERPAAATASPTP